MNQSILLNDDYQYDNSKASWKFTGLLAGQLITIYINSESTTLSSDIKFTFEDMVEEYLIDNEPDEDNHIWL